MVVTSADMHIHLDQFDDPVQTALDAERAGCAMLCATTTPQGYLGARKLLRDCGNVRVAAGLHPWWLDGRCDEQDVELLESLIKDERYIGEVGLDFLEKHAAKSTWERQAAVFRRICAVAGNTGNKVLTIHSVRSSATVLDILEETGCLSNCTCILHWFSDSADLMWRAIRAGVYFSVGARSLATGKGREYIKLIPRDRLLFETDMPWPGDAERGYAAIAESLARAQAQATEIIGLDRVLDACANAKRILAL